MTLSLLSHITHNITTIS